MTKTRLAMAFLAIALILSPIPLLRAQTTVAPAAPIPSQIIAAKKAFISNAGGLLDLNMVSGDTRRDYNQFYAAVHAWGRYELVAAPADADLVIQISIVYLPRQVGAEVTPFPAFRVALLDPKTNIVLWVLDEYLVDKPGLGLILKKNRDKVFDQAIEKLVGDLKMLVTPPVDAAN